MNRTSIRRVIAPSVAALAIGAALTGCGASNEGSGDSGSSSLKGTLKGAGSSAQEAAQAGWRSAFQTKNSGVTINYNPIGSGGGVEQFLAGAVDFAGSDAALDPSAGETDKAKKACGGDYYEAPDYISPIAIIYNLKGVDDLQLDSDTLSAIMAGKITTWNDPAIAKLNPNAQLPSTAITPVHRSDESGTTKNFTDYLNQTSPSVWTNEASEDWPYKSGEGANGTSGVVAAVQKGDGSIGYADASQAGSLQTAKIKVGDAYVAPTADAAAKALEASPTDNTRGANDLVVTLDRKTTAAGAYPIALTSYLITCAKYDSAKADLVKAYASYVVSSAGQADGAKAAGSAALPSSISDKAEKIFEQISAK